jgi:DNA-binding XRE family transcriptional regulator
VAKVDRPISRYAADAAILLGQLIRKARIERRMTVAALAERAGTSRGLLQRIEAGDRWRTLVRRRPNHDIARHRS